MRQQSATSSAKSSASGNRLELSGVFSFAKFKNAEGFIIGILQSGETIKGTLAEEDELVSGNTYRFLGRWLDDPRWGRQFSFDTFTEDAPHNQAGVVAYLAKFAPGIGPARAANLFARYGADAVEVLVTNPKQTVKDKILSEKDAKEANLELTRIDALRKTKIDLFTIFNKRGFPGQLIGDCISLWGVGAPDEIKKNPFNLLEADLRGCGFKRVDKLYLDLKHDPASLIRQSYCIWHHLHSSQEGHTWHPYSEIRKAIGDLIGTDGSLHLAANEAIAKKRIRIVSHGKQKWVAEEGKANAEEIVVRELKRLLSWPRVEWPRDIFSSSPEAAKPGRIVPTPHQITELTKALSLPIGIFMGSPGVGKTAVAGFLVDALSKTGTSKLAICAPTGKAAVRCTQAIRRACEVPVSASTIHGLMKAQPSAGGYSFEHNHVNKLPYKFIVCDESSMVDVGLLAQVLSACADGTHILFVGDKYQLPPVGSGAPLRDLMECLTSVGELTELHRNSGLIARTCKEIKEGKPVRASLKFDDATGINLRHVESQDADQTIEILTNLYAKLLTNKTLDPISDTQVLCAVNSKSKISRNEVNKVLQPMLNPTGHREPGCTFATGDKIICLKNNWFAATDDTPAAVNRPLDALAYHFDNDEASKVRLANGEIGIVLAVSTKHIVAQFRDPVRVVKIQNYQCRAREAEEGKDASEADFSLAYAVTGHKMQGSEVPFAILLIDDYPGAKFVCSREYVYTCISRASRRCLTIGRLATMNSFCKRVSLTDRKTFLKEYFHASETPVAVTKIVPAVRSAAVEAGD